MPEPDRIYVENRGAGRREADRRLMDEIFRQRTIFNSSRAITSEMNLDSLLDVIMHQTMELLEASRCTLFLHDSRSDQLWSMSGTGIRRNRIRIHADCGVAGWVFQNRRPLIIDDAYADPRFYPRIDEVTGFRTRNILCIPLVNQLDECIGSLQALNKIHGNFTAEDQHMLSAISLYMTIALENARLYDNLLAVTRTREKVINHLAHELRTPVAVIEAGLVQISKTAAGDEKLERPVRRCRRNLKRLMNLQDKISDIHNHGLAEEKERVTTLIEDIVSLAEEASDGTDDPSRSLVLERMLERLESIYAVDDYRPETIDAAAFLDAVCDGAVAAMGDRSITVDRRFESRLFLKADPRMLEKVCGGLLKNAIEATPDEGRVRVELRRSDDDVVIDFRDWGVGISEENQHNLFSGFFHTQDTDYYCSKNPYAFYAGGSGADLLRIKAFSERYGFSVSFVSKCCRHIPENRNRCPGRVSRCRFVDGLHGCMASGGSRFRLRFRK